ncbi:MAG: selenide, water dikinase SelD [Candidatus Cloacimonetes bacterium 4572_55]|nr:MAG: selenide, water dikinase SelD [Candidatus Cloacimonetes bacterium 4572_55]
MGPEALAQVLRPLQKIFPTDRYPQVTVGLEDGDDAAVYQINAHTAVIHTLDFFTPIVDDPYDFGAIAAANAMSDVYAMGGEVVMALNICGFPADFPAEIVSEILRGGAEKVMESGGILAGGHTVQDSEPKYGLSVMGIAHPSCLLTKAGARPGDLLFLTKPLGSGMTTTAFKADAADPSDLAVAVQSMTRLNRKAAQIIRDVSAQACTDISGFALLGHAYDMASQSSICFRIHGENLPFLPGAVQYAEDWLFPASSCRNQKYYGPHIRFDSNMTEEMQLLLFTPETSGGLLVAVSPEKSDRLQHQFDENKEFCRLIGVAIQSKGGERLIIE